MVSLAVPAPPSLCAFRSFRARAPTPSMRTILHGLFGSRTLESRYRTRHLAEDRALASWVLALCPIVLLPFLALDASLFGDSPTFWLLVAARGGLLVVTLGLIAWLRRVETVEDFDVVLVTWAVLFLGADLFLVATRPPGYVGPLLAHVAVPLVVFIGLPLNLRTQTGLALVWSGGYVAVLAGLVRPGGRGFWPTAATGLALSLVFGYLAARRWHQTRRGLHAAREEIEHLKARAEKGEVLDPLTGLHNRQGWLRRLHAEESRFKRHGGSACVLAVDLHGLRVLNDAEGPEAGDSLLRRAAHALQRIVREPDVVARLAGTEFLVLGVGCGAAGGDVLAERVREALDEAHIDATVGHSVRDHGRDLHGAWREAEEDMRDRRSVRNVHGVPLPSS